MIRTQRDGWMTLADVARGLGVSRQRVFQYVRDGSLHTTRFGGRTVLVSASEYARFVRARSKKRTTAQHLTDEIRAGTAAGYAARTGRAMSVVHLYNRCTRAHGRELVRIDAATFDPKRKLCRACLDRFAREMQHAEVFA